MPNRQYRLTIRGPQSDMFILAKTAKEACEHAAKSTRDGQEIVIEDETGKVMSETDLAALVRQGE